MAASAIDLGGVTVGSCAGHHDNCVAAAVARQANFDPWGGFNPREVWVFTILIAGISYAGYVAVRILGPRRGLVVSSVTGAVVSSTAVTVALGSPCRDLERRTHSGWGGVPCGSDLHHSRGRRSRRPAACRGSADCDRGARRWGRLRLRRSIAAVRQAIAGPLRFAWVLFMVTLVAMALGGIAFFLGATLS